jgi:excisionase family DNA binding protein
MTLTDLLTRLEAMPPGSLVPRDWLLSELDGAAESGEEEREAVSGDLTLEEVAKRLGRSKTTVRGWCTAGQLRGYKLNNREWRVPVSALEQFLEEQRAGTSSKPKPSRAAEDADLGSWRKVLRGEAA